MAQTVKVSACSAGDPGSLPGSGRCPGEENGNPLQYSCLENSMDGGAWWATVRGVTKSQTGLIDFTYRFTAERTYGCTSVWVWNEHRLSLLLTHCDFSDFSDGKESACNAGDPGSVPGWRRCPGERNGNPLQYSCLRNPKDRGAWWAITHGVAESQMWLRG